MALQGAAELAVAQQLVVALAESLAEVLPYRVFDARIRTRKAIQRASSFRVSVAQMGDREALRDFSALLDEWSSATALAGVG